MRFSSLLVFLLAGCESNRRPGAETIEKSNDGLARLEVDDLHYDGSRIAGRFLVTAKSREILVHQNLPGTDLEMVQALECGSHLSFAVVMPEHFTKPPDLFVRVRPGVWYGASSRFPMMNGPKCVEVKFDVMITDEGSGDRVRGASTTVRLHREATPIMDLPPAG